MHNLGVRSNSNKNKHSKNVIFYLSVTLGAELAVPLEGAIKNKVPTGPQNLSRPADNACGNSPRGDMEDIGGDHQIVSGRADSGFRDSVPVFGLSGIELKGSSDAVIGGKVGSVGVDGGEEGGVILGWLESNLGIGVREVIDVLS